MASEIIGADGKPISSKKTEGEMKIFNRTSLIMATIAALGGLLLGSGGVFGVVQYLDTREIESYTLEIDYLNKQYLVAQQQADLADTYREQKEELQEELDELKLSNNSPQSISSVESQLAIVDKNLTYLLSRQDLPGWARVATEEAQQSLLEATR